MQTVLSFCGAGKSLAFKLDTTKTIVDQSKRPKLTLTSFDQVLSGAPYNPIWFTFEKDPRLTDKSQPSLETANVVLNFPVGTSDDGGVDANAVEFHLSHLRRVWCHASSVQQASGNDGDERGGARQNTVRLLGNRVEPTDAMLRSLLAPVLHCQTAADVNRLNHHLMFFRQSRSGGGGKRESIECQSCYAKESRKGWCAFEAMIANAIHSLWFVQLPRLGASGAESTDPRQPLSVTMEDMDSFSPCTQTFGRRVFVFGDEFPLHIEPLIFQAPSAYEPRLTLGATLSTPPQFYEVADNDDIYLHVPRKKRIKLPKQERHRILFGSTSAHFAQTFRQFMPSPAAANPSSANNTRTDQPQEQRQAQLFACSAYGLPNGCSSMQDYLTTLSTLSTLSPGMRALIASISVSSTVSHPEKQKQRQRQSPQQQETRKRNKPKRASVVQYQQVVSQEDEHAAVGESPDIGHDQCQLTYDMNEERLAIIGDGFDVSSEWNVGVPESFGATQDDQHNGEAAQIAIGDTTAATVAVPNRKKRKRKQSSPSDDTGTAGSSSVYDSPPMKKRRTRRSKQEIMAEKLQRQQAQEDIARFENSDETVHAFDPSLSYTHDQQAHSLYFHHQQQQQHHTPIYDAHASFHHYQWPSQFNEESYVAAGSDPESREWQLAHENSMIDAMEQGADTTIDEAPAIGTESTSVSGAGSENIPQLTGAALPFHFEEQQYDTHSSDQTHHQFQHEYYHNCDTQPAYVDHATNGQYMHVDETSNGPSSCPLSTSYPLHNEASIEAALLYRQLYPHSAYLEEWNGRALSSHEMVSNFFQSNLEKSAHALVDTHDGAATFANPDLSSAAVKPVAKRRGRKSKIVKDVPPPSSPSTQTTDEVSSPSTTADETQRANTTTHKKPRRKRGNDDKSNKSAATGTTSTRKSTHGVVFWTDRDSLTKLMFVCRRVSVPSGGDDEGATHESRGVYIEQSALKLRGIGLYVHSPERLSALVRRYASETFKSSLMAYVADASTASIASNYNGDDEQTTVVVFNHRLGIEQRKILPKKTDLYQWCIFTCAFAEEPFKTYLVRLMVSLLRRHRRESTTPPTPDEDKIFTTLSQHKDITKAARISGVQHQQILDAYYWSFLSEYTNVSLTRVLQYYSLAGVEARLKNGYSRTGLHTGRNPALGVLRDYATHRKASYLMAKRAVSSTTNATGVVDVDRASASVAIVDGEPTSNETDSKIVICKRRKPKTTQSKYVMTARQDIQTPFGYDLIRVGSDTKRASLIRPANAPLFVLTAKHHVGKSVEEVLSPEDLRRLNFVKDDAPSESSATNHHTDYTPTHDVDASSMTASSPSSNTTTTYCAHSDASLEVATVHSPSSHGGEVCAGATHKSLLSNSMDISLPIPELIVMSNRRSMSGGLAALKDDALSCASSNFGHFSSVLPTSGSFATDD